LFLQNLLKSLDACGKPDPFCFGALFRFVFTVWQAVSPAAGRFRGLHCLTAGGADYSARCMRLKRAGAVRPFPVKTSSPFLFDEQPVSTGETLFYSRGILQL
jgi:hypothetical protein